MSDANFCVLIKSDTIAWWSIDIDLDIVERMNVDTVQLQRRILYRFTPENGRTHWIPLAISYSYINLDRLDRLRKFTAIDVFTWIGKWTIEINEKIQMQRFVS